MAINTFVANSRQEIQVDYLWKYPASIGTDKKERIGLTAKTPWVKKFILNATITKGVL